MSATEQGLNTKRTALTHTCPAIGCSRVVKDQYLMCASHWRLVPREIRGKIWSYVKKDRARYFEAVKEAVNEVAYREGCIEPTTEGDQS